MRNSQLARRRRATSLIKVLRERRLALDPPSLIVARQRQFSCVLSLVRVRARAYANSANQPTVHVSTAVPLRSSLHAKSAPDRRCRKSHSSDSHAKWLELNKKPDFGAVIAGVLRPTRGHPWGVGQSSAISRPRTGPTFIQRFFFTRASISSVNEPIACRL